VPLLHSDVIKKYAAGLREEMDRRQMSYLPILWL
jgi:hypothetical protein